jgi:hypothetical protein
MNVKFKDRHGESLATNSESQMRSDEEDNGKNKLSAEQVLQMLREEGMNITLEQSRLILEFLRKLANITVSNYLKTKQ